MASIKISADTSEVKKSILSLNKSLKDLKGSKISIFNESDKKFIKTEFKKEMVLLKNKIKENREEISKLVDEQQKVVKGSKEELELRKKIIESYKVQAKLGKELGSVKSGVGNVGGKMGAVGGIAMGGLVTAVLGALAFGVTKTIQATSQYVGGTPNRNRLSGLGVKDQNFGGAGELARVGLTEQEMIDRRVQATSVLGRQGTSQKDEMRKAGFERAFGLEGGTMTGISAQLRPSMGGQGANEAQLKLQASVFASGIEDALAPYLESATALLSQINENGTTNTDEMINLLSQMTKDGQRTPELLAKAFGGIDSAVRGATGEQSAFLQTAFARGGIGGGTIGGTKFAMSSGGMMGTNRNELEKRGYNKDLLDQMQKSGMFKGVSERAGAVMDLIRQSGGMKKGEKVSDVKDMNKAIGMGNLANSIFGTKGGQGFDVLMMLEKVQSKKMSQKDFDAKLKEMQEGKDPSVQRLDKINSTLSGQTEILTLINNNLMENLGKAGVVTRNVGVGLENEGIKATTTTVNGVNATGAVEGAGNATQGVAAKINSGYYGGKLADVIQGHNETMDQKLGPGNALSQQAMKPGSLSGEPARQIGKEIAKAITKLWSSPQITNKIQLPDGRVTDKTSR